MLRSTQWVLPPVLRHEGEERLPLPVVQESLLKSAFLFAK